MSGRTDSKYVFSIERTSSGVCASENAVKPWRSANRIVTSRVPPTTSSRYRSLKRSYSGIRHEAYAIAPNTTTIRTCHTHQEIRQLSVKLTAIAASANNTHAAAMAISSPARRWRASDR